MFQSESREWAKANDSEKPKVPWENARLEVAAFFPVSASRSRSLCQAFFLKREARFFLHDECSIFACQISRKGCTRNRKQSKSHCFCKDYIKSCSCQVVKMWKTNFHYITEAPPPSKIHILLQGQGAQAKKNINPAFAASRMACPWPIICQDMHTVVEFKIHQARFSSAPIKTWAREYMCEKCVHRCAWAPLQN